MSDTKLQIGATGELEWDVDRTWCTQRGDYHIFSTPSMVQLAERAAMAALAPVLNPDQISVGTSVVIRHLAPTLEGMKVRAVAKVTGIDKAKVTFDIEIFDELEKIGECTHERFILDLPRYIRRLEKKREQLSADRADRAGR